MIRRVIELTEEVAEDTAMVFLLGLGTISLVIVFSCMLWVRAFESKGFEQAQVQAQTQEKVVIELEADNHRFNGGTYSGKV